MTRTLLEGGTLTLGLMVTGSLAGAFLFTLTNVVPTFSEVPIAVHIAFRVQLMKHTGVVMPALMALSILSSFGFAIQNRYEPAARNLALLAVVLALITFLVTRFGNVPINQVIRTWDPDHLPGGWKDVLTTWNRFHLIRCITALGCFTSFCLAVLVVKLH